MNPVIHPYRPRSRTYRIGRAAAVLLIVVLATLTVRSTFGATSHPAPPVPQIVRDQAPSLCTQYPNAHFEFISTHTFASLPTPPVCGENGMLSV